MPVVMPRRDCLQLPAPMPTMTRMKIGVISDSHDRLPTLRRALALFKRMKLDAVLHAGDFVAPFAAKLLVGPDSPHADGVPLHCIYGNNDGERAGLKKILPMVADGPWRGSIGGKTIVMHHWIDWLKPADLTGADIIITGHTHEIVNETRTDTGKPVLHLNPGECCGWLTDRCTVAIVDTDTLTAQIIEVAP
jgi:putative phosphoesterase